MNRTSGHRFFVKESKFSKLLAECQKSLDTLTAESQHTLALVRLVREFPKDPERKTALLLQCHRENRLRLGYQARRAELLRLVTDESQTDTAA